MTRAQLEALSEFSLTLPTGTTRGRQWRRAIPAFDPEEWWLGQYGRPIPNPDVDRRRFEGQETVVPIFWRRIIILGEPARWPRSVRVDRRPVRR